MKHPAFTGSPLSLFFTTAACLIVIPTGCSKHHYPKVSNDPAVQYRYEWNCKTLVDPYEQAGHTNPKWDEPAELALTEFARVRAQCTESNEAPEMIMSTNCAAAVDAGCDDPMIRYLYNRFSMSQTNSSTAFTEAFCETAKDMQQSTYPPIRKFYAATRALDQIFYTYGTNSPHQPVEREIMPLISQSVETALNDKTMPAREAYEIANRALYLVSGDTNNYQQAYNCIEKPLTNNWPDDYTTWLLKGTAYIRLAWNARGGGYADTVSEAGWKLFGERLGTAQADLEHAWQLYPKDPEIAHQMMTVMLGQGGDRDRMELWFNRSMAINPNDYDACSAKLYYLEPKWYGSQEAMLDFGRECVHNTNWGGHVPLILMDAHHAIYTRYVDPSEKTNYWNQPYVWADLKASFDRFFELNPGAVGSHHDFAWYAYQCGQWDEFNRQLSLFSTGTNYDYFGGKAEFDKMVQRAKDHSREPK